MKPAGIVLLVPATFLVGWAEPDRGGLVSREIKAHVREGLPHYEASVRAAAESSPVGNPDATPGPDVLVLPKMTVKERRLPRDADDHLMSRKDFQRKMENIYLDEIAKDGPLNYALNCFTIPILSPSKAARGHAIYVQRETDRLSSIPLDPAEQKILRREIERGTREPGPMTMER